MSEQGKVSTHDADPDERNKHISIYVNGRIVPRAEGRRLQATLGRGQRLVSMEGDLWRWDGLTLAADEAPSAAALRLRQRNRSAAAKVALAEAEAAAAALQAGLEEATSAGEAAARAEAEGRPISAIKRLMPIAGTQACRA